MMSFSVLTKSFASKQLVEWREIINFPYTERLHLAGTEI